MVSPEIKRKLLNIVAKYNEICKLLKLNWFYFYKVTAKKIAKFPFCRVRISRKQRHADYTRHALLKMTEL